MARTTTAVKPAASPEVLPPFRVSSFMVRQTSQPQKAKIDRLRPTANAENELMCSGLNQSQLNARCPGCAEAFEIPATTNQARTTTWKPTSRNCTVRVVCRPRQEIQTAR